MQRRLVGWLVG